MMLVFCWAVRLTTNWAHGWSGLALQDLHDDSNAAASCIADGIEQAVAPLDQVHAAKKQISTRPPVQLADLRFQCGQHL